MTGIVWCNQGHDVTEPGNVYTSRTGRRSCRLCRVAYTKAWRLQNKDRPRLNPRRPIRVTVEPDRMRRWAQIVWEDMTPRDRILVRHALANMELP